MNDIKPLAHCVPIIDTEYEGIPDENEYDLFDFEDDKYDRNEDYD